MITPLTEYTIALFLPQRNAPGRLSSLFLLLHLLFLLVRLRWSFLYFFLFFVRHGTNPPLNTGHAARSTSILPRH